MTCSSQTQTHSSVSPIPDLFMPNSISHAVVNANIWVCACVLMLLIQIMHLNVYSPQQHKRKDLKIICKQSYLTLQLLCHKVQSHCLQMTLSADHYEAGPLPAQSSVPVHDQLLIRDDSICILTSHLRQVTHIVLCEICSILLLITVLGTGMAMCGEGGGWGQGRQLGSEVVKLWTKLLMSNFGLAPLRSHNLLLMHVPFEFFLDDLK